MTGKDIKWSLLPSGFPVCQEVDLTKVFDLSTVTPLFLSINLKAVKNFGISLQIVDRQKSLAKRSLRSQRQDYEGAPVEIENLYSRVITRYYLKVSQKIHLEMETGIKCINYPHQDFASYRECDENFVYKEMKDTYNLMPFWAATNDEEVTNLA